MKDKGFTLMELAVGVALATLLIWMVANGMQQAKKNATLAKTQAQISGLITAIKMYEIDTEYYPGENNKTLIEALTTENDVPGWKGPYIKIKKSELNENGEYLDAWGNVFIYINPGINNISSYDLYSKGPDGKGDGNSEDDIKNWGEGSGEENDI